MTKVRTVIPANAKPGQSVIQVMHPKTGKPTRVKVPKAAVAGQMVELDLPDEVSPSPATASKVDRNRPESGVVPSGEDTSHASTGVSGSSPPIAMVPHPSQLPSPPVPIPKEKGAEDQPLLGESPAKSIKNSGCCGACVSGGFVKTLFS